MCSDCGVALVDDLPPEPVAEQQRSTMRLGPTATEVWRGFSDLEAHVTRSMLESNGIDAEVWSAGVGANVHFDDTIAHRVMVNAQDAREAKGLIAATATT